MSEIDDIGADLLGMLNAVMVEADEPESGPVETEGKSSTVSTDAMKPKASLGAPVGWRPELARELAADLRSLGCHSSGKTVEVLRIVSTMVCDTDAGRRAASCLIHAIARRAGLRLAIEDDPHDWPNDMPTLWVR